MASFFSISLLLHAKAIIVLGARRKDSCATMEVPIEVSSLTQLWSYERHR